MKHFYIPTLLIAGTLALASCYGDEPANSECDIERAWVHVDDPNAIFYHKADTIADILPSYSSDNIQFPLARYDANIGLVPLYLEITPGAKVFTLDINNREVPFVNGDKIDFSNDREQKFVVHSESGEYKREYTIRIKHDKAPTINTSNIDLGQLIITGISATAAGSATNFTYNQRTDIAPYGEVPVQISGTKDGETLQFTLNIQLSSEHSIDVSYANGEYRGTYDGAIILPKRSSASLVEQTGGGMKLTLDDINFNTATIVNFNFEDVALDESNTFNVWSETDPLCEPDIWATGNPGFQLSMSSATRPDYPTVSEDGGVDGGKCVKLTTRSTGGFGEMVNMRIAAGNLFMGTFDVGNAMKNALAATRMGLPFAHKPLYLSGYYKFIPGKTKQDKDGNPIAGEEDVCDWYCVVYKNMDEKGERVQLDGSDVLSSKYIVGKARVKSEDINNTGEEWIHFELPVEYTAELNRDDVLARQYSVAIVFSSSIDGAYFRGTVGSTLWIDNVTLMCEY